MALTMLCNVAYIAMPLLDDLIQKEKNVDVGKTRSTTSRGLVTRPDRRTCMRGTNRR